MSDITEIGALLLCANSLDKEKFELLERNAELERENAKLRSAHKHDLWCIITSLRARMHCCNYSGDWTPEQIAEFHEKTLNAIEDACLKQNELLKSSEK
jgi:hypothetical protein